MQVGNGEFAFGFDISGMQTFSDNANTMSNWGWYRFPLPQGRALKISGRGMGGAGPYGAL